MQGVLKPGMQLIEQRAELAYPLLDRETAGRLLAERAEAAEAAARKAAKKSGRKAGKGAGGGAA